MSARHDHRGQAAEGESMPKKTEEHWTKEPNAHDYSAAASYLSLVMQPDVARRVVAELERTPMERRRANDLLRASALALLPSDDPQVAKNLKMIKQGKKLAPVLAVRGDTEHGRPLVIADGYHRICASYLVSEDTEIPCRIAAVPALPPPTARAAARPASRPAKRPPAEAVARSVTATPAGEGVGLDPGDGGRPGRVPGP
jgi:hypothetical protein